MRRPARPRARAAAVSLLFLSVLHLSLLFLRRTQTLTSVHQRATRCWLHFSLRCPSPVDSSGHLSGSTWARRGGVEARSPAAAALLGFFSSSLKASTVTAAQDISHLPPFIKIPAAFNRSFVLVRSDLVIWTVTRRTLHTGSETGCV